MSFDLGLTRRYGTASLYFTDEIFECRRSQRRDVADSMAALSSSMKESKPLDVGVGVKALTAR
jgi:hypothetical protein